MQGGIDHDGNLSARFNQGWSATNVSKVQLSVRILLSARPRPAHARASCRKPRATA
jgi:hypothetical protein